MKSLSPVIEAVQYQKTRVPLHAPCMDHWMAVFHAIDATVARDVVMPNQGLANMDFQKWPNPEGNWKPNLTSGLIREL